MDGYTSRFGGLGRLFGVSALARLRTGHVCIIGVGGVGTWAAEACARSGVGSITLVDMDDVCITNSNRQLPAMEGTIGRPKITVMAERLRRINPDISVHEVHDFFTESTADSLLAAPFDFLIDAIDSAPQKALLIDGCRRRAIPLVTVGGAGGRWDPTQIQIADLTQSFNDGLLKQVRKKLRRAYDYPVDATPWGVAAVFSRERAIFPASDGGLCRVGSGTANLRLDCASGFGAASFVTGTYGFAAASVAIQAIAQPDEPRQGAPPDASE
jgi:tRNA A37 threonylcarbamoyladenosine dehydratase